MRNPIKLNNQHSILKIKLQNFRSYKEIELDFTNDHVVLYGPNGSGKTNFLEAISLLLPGRGLRSSKKEHFPLIEFSTKKQNNDWAIHYILKRGNKTNEISTGIKTSINNINSSRIYKVDGSILKSKEMSQLVSLNWLTPTMHNIITGSETLRRNFFDRMISALDPHHKTRINKLEKLSRERMKLIEKNLGDESWFSVLEKEISQLSIAIIVERQNFTSKLDFFTANPKSSFLNSVRISWSGIIEEWLQNKPAIDVEEKMAIHLKNLRLERSFSSFGPSSSVLKIWYGSSHISSEFCSTGQQKSILVSIVLAYSKLLTEKKEFPPILLLDEASAHLDDDHFNALFYESLETSSQIWMTGTDKNIFKRLGYSENIQYLVINDSNITQLVDL